jgi:hypothetical protein
VRVTVAWLVMCAVAVVGCSYVHALTAPGYATWTDRTVGWVREYGGAPVVDALENWYYTRHPPPKAVPDHGSLPTLSPSRVTAPLTLPRLPNLSHLPVESVWVPGRRAARGGAAEYHAYFQPDPDHAGIVVGAALLPVGASVVHLMAGTSQPGGLWPGVAHVSRADVPNLVATFNAGYKFRDIRGGFYSDHTMGRPLVAGAATMAIDDRGRLSVGVWGSSIVMNPHLVAARQNLSLVVDGARPVPGLADNRDGQWGAHGSQRQYTWRSGVGTDRQGNVIYVAGNHLNLATLASAMTQAGIVTGMELDIHSGMVTYCWWAPKPSGWVTPHQLLPTMPVSAYRYLNPDQRDFLYVTTQ